MGTPFISISHCWCLQSFRDLFKGVRVRPADPEQFVFLSDLYPDFSDRQTMFRGESRRRFCMDMGSAALCDVLVYAVGVGDQPLGPAPRPDFSAHARDARERWLEALGLFRAPLGHRCIK